jgi:hypothetical protein
VPSEIASHFHLVINVDPSFNVSYTVILIKNMPQSLLRRGKLVWNSFLIKSCHLEFYTKFGLGKCWNYSKWLVIMKERMMQTSFIITYYAIPIINCNGDLKYGELSVGRASCTHYGL